MAPWWVTNKGNCNAGRNSMRVCLIVSPSTLQRTFVRLLQRRLIHTLRPVSQFLRRLLMKSTKPSHNFNPIMHQGSVVSLLNCWRLVVLVAPSGWQISSARLGTPVRPTMIGKRELFCPSIKGKDLEQTVKITEALHYFQCQARSMLMCYLPGSKHTFTISAVPNRVVLHLTGRPSVILLPSTWFYRQDVNTENHLGWCTSIFNQLDYVDRQSLWLLLRSKGIPEKILRLLEDLYSNTFSCVRVYGEVSPWFETSVVRHGCVVAHELFLEPMDWITNRAAHKGFLCVTVGEEICTDLDYADDVSPC